MNNRQTAYATFTSGLALYAILVGTTDAPSAITWTIAAGTTMGLTVAHVYLGRQSPTEADDSPRIENAELRRFAWVQLVAHLIAPGFFLAFTAYRRAAASLHLATAPLFDGGASQALCFTLAGLCCWVGAAGLYVILLTGQDPPKRDATRRESRSAPDPA